MAANIGLVLVLLDIVFFGPREDLPVDVSDVVSGVIVSIVRKLHAEAAMRTFVDSG
jgi:hypothetical protein